MFCKVCSLLSYAIYKSYRHVLLFRVFQYKNKKLICGANGVQLTHNRASFLLPFHWLPHKFANTYIKFNKHSRYTHTHAICLVDVNVTVQLFNCVPLPRLFIFICVHFSCNIHSWCVFDEASKNKIKNNFEIHLSL